MIAIIKAVNPLKLELCGTLSQFNLIDKFRTDLNILDVNCFTWCDSSIVLHSLRGYPNRINAFVANRISNVLEHSNLAHYWRLILGNEYPSDCAIRQTDTLSLQTYTLWWTEPPWISQITDFWPTSKPELPKEFPELKIISLAVCVEDNRILIIHPHSSLTALRPIAFVKRFVYNTRFDRLQQRGPLTSSELSPSFQAFTLPVQETTFPPDYRTAQTVNCNSLTRWQLVQKMRNDFWKRWQREYVTRLQQRPKWATKSRNIEENDLVLIIEDNLPPTRWALGRIVQVHPGTDGLVRVATVKCQGSTLKRPVAKLDLLPLSCIPPTAQ